MADEESHSANNVGLRPTGSGLARPYRSHRVPACDFCHRRKSRCDRHRLNEPCSLCRAHRKECTTSGSGRAAARRSATHPRHSRWVASPTSITTGNAVLNQQGDLHNPAFSANAVEPIATATPPATSGVGLSGHIVGPTLARDAQMLEQYISPRDNAAVSHVHPNPYSVYSDDPRNPVVYLKVPRQRSTASSGNGTPGFKQCEIIDKILDPLGPHLIELYFDVVHPPFPILDETAVRKAYQQAALPHTLVCEIFAVSLVFWTLSDKISASGRPPPDVKYVWNLTVSAMHDDFLSPSFSTVLACILDLLGRPITSITYNAVNVGSAVALAQSLGLNRDPTSWNLDARQKNLRIRTWWALLIHDYWASLCHGTPSHIHRDQWDVALPELGSILDGVSTDESPVSEARIKGAQSFIALCQLTRTLGEVLPVVYSLRNEPLEHTLKILRRLEASLDEWQDALPPWLNPSDADFDRDQPGSLNLRLSFLAVKMCIYRVALQATRINDYEEALYHQARCIKAGDALIDSVVSLSIDETRAFWLPYTAYHFASAATLMMRCALETQADSTASKCVTSARKLMHYLRKMKTEADWDLADICLGQCELTVKQMSEGGYLEFRRRNKEMRKSQHDHAQTQPRRPALGDQTTTDDNVTGANATTGDDIIPTDESIWHGILLADSHEHTPENFYFPELWQVSYSDFHSHWI